MTDFGIRLKQAMDEKNMTASDLSKASGISKSLISYYLRGKYLAKQDKVYLLAEALNVDPGWLIYGYEKHDIEPAEFWFQEMQKKNEPQLMEICETYMKLNDKQRKLFMNILRTLDEEANS